MDNLKNKTPEERLVEQQLKEAEHEAYIQSLKEEGIKAAQERGRQKALIEVEKMRSGKSSSSSASVLKTLSKAIDKMGSSYMSSLNSDASALKSAKSEHREGSEKPKPKKQWQPLAWLNE